MNETDIGKIGVRREHLAKLDHWTAIEAGLFSLGLAPTGPLSEPLGGLYAGDKKLWFYNVGVRVDQFTRYADKLPPGEWVAWCDSKGIPFEADLKRLIALPETVQITATTKTQEKRWTPEFLQEVDAYRRQHTETETAKYFGVSGSRIRAKLKEWKDSRKPKSSTYFPS